MITSIQLGNIFKSGDRTIVTGGGSGLDIESLVNGLSEVKRLPAVQLEERLEENALRRSSFKEFGSILSRYQDAAALLRNPPGVSNAKDNIFEYRNASVTSNSGISASTYLDAIAAPGAELGDYNIKVNSLASFNVQTTETFALANLNTDAVGDGLPFSAGTLALGPFNKEIQIGENDTLAQIVTKINSVSNESFVRASTIRVADGQYRLQFKTTETGTAYNYSFADAGAAKATLSTPNQIFRYDATDIDGDGDTSNNPANGYNFNGQSWNDSISGNNASEGGGGAQTLINPGINGLPAIDFSTSTSSILTVANNNDLNTGGPYAQKTFAVAIQTGSDISGTQTIYEQGDSNQSIGIFIAPDPDNGNAPTLFGTLHNSSATPGNEWKTVNMGVVTADTSYNVMLELDASANPAVNDPANTLKGYVNGTLKDTQTGVTQLDSNSGAAAIGGSKGGVGFPDETTSGAASAFFKGKMGEFIGTNTKLSDTQRTALDSYLYDKWQNAAPASNGSVLKVGIALTTQANDAQVTIDGTTITRSTNAIDDLIKDVTFNIKQITPPGTEITIDIEPDTDIARDAILNFVDTYNELRIFYSRQTEINDEGVATDNAILRKSPTLRTMMNNVLSELTAVVGGLNTAPNKLADLGITLEDFPGDDETPFTRNILVVDTDTLEKSLKGNFEAARKVFEFDFVSDNANVQIFKRSNSLSATNFTLNLDVTNGIYQANVEGTIVDLDATAISGGGFLLKGKTGTALAGLEMIYGGNADSTANINISQGIADRLFNVMKVGLDPKEGFIKTELDSLISSDERINQDIARIDSIVERFRIQQLQRFAALEQLISSTNTILQSLDAQANANQG